jgi:apolipoprotein N-acyltransferase
MWGGGKDTVAVLGRRITDLGLSVLSALLLFAAGEPLAIGPLAWFALVPLLVAVLRSGEANAGAQRRRDGRWASLYGLVFGLAYFGVHLSWIFLFGWMAWTALTFVLSLYTVAATFVAARVQRFAFGPLLIAGAWAGAELLRDRWPYGGYSWGSVGTTQAGVPAVRWFAGVVGVYGLTFLVVFVATLVAWWIVRRESAWRNVAVVAGALVAFTAVDVAAFGRPSRGRPFRVAVVQGDVPRPVVVRQRDAILRNHVDATRSLLGGRTVDVVIWPEEAIGTGVSPGALEEVQLLASELSTPFVVGQTFVDDEDRFLNIVRHIDASGRVVGTYQKRHPVPFGEYVPIAFFRRFVGTLNSEIPTDQVPGTVANVFDVEGTRIATPICFESVFPRDFLDFTRNDAELFVLSTNDSSFERSYASEQHIAHARVRALETRQWVIEAALSGISGVAAPDGRLSNTTDLFATDAFVVDVYARRAQSLYAKTGDLFPEAFAAAAGVAFLWTLRRRRSAELESAA